MKNSDWKVYILECLDGSYYTGITTDIEKRMLSHQTGKGSKYVYSRGFKRLISYISFPDRSSASKEEYKIKQLSKEEKLSWFQGKQV